MAINLVPVRWAASLGAVMAVGSAALLPGLAGAQTPPGPADNAVAIRCVAAGPISGTRPVEEGAFQAMAVSSADAVFGTTDENFAASLAEALGMSTAAVEAAIESARAEAPAFPDDAVDVNVVAVTNDPAVLATVAEALDVTVADLEAAVEATTGCPSSDDPSDGPAEIRAEEGDIFEAIAAELGGGITGDEVRSAFAAAQPEGSHPDIVPAHPTVVFDVEALAEALGITVEDLEEAMESIMSQRRP